MLKFLVKVFKSLYLLNMLMDQVDTLHDGRYWSEVLCGTITTHLGNLEVKVTDLELFYVISLYQICTWIKLILCMLVDIGLKFYAVPSRPT